MTDAEFFERVGRTLATYKVIDDRVRSEIATLMAQKDLEFEHALHQSAKVDLAIYRRVLEEVSGCVAVDPSQITIDPEFIESILRILPLQAIVALKIFPISLRGNELTVAMQNPTATERIQELESTTSLRVKPVVTTYRGVQQAIELNYGPKLREVIKELRGVEETNVLDTIFQRKLEEGMEGAYEEFLALVNRAYDRAREEDEDLVQFLAHPVVVDYTQRLLMDVILRNCSDIHIEPATDKVRVRARVNGVLQTIHTLPKKAGEVVVMRVKMMSNLDLRNYPAPADSQINYSPVYGRRVEFRVSVLPTINGNKVVARLLEKKNQNVGLEKIGLQPDDLTVVRRNIAAPNGLILVTGPTGSGKTSTLYSILSVLNDDETCVVTAEEPVESEIPGVVQVACGKDCTFAMALRSFLRQDPDVIMVGEIRDQETADIALKAALTGHLVLSTLHTNDAPTAVMRLLNLDMDPFVVASSLRMVIAQRLMRVLCPHCKKPASREDLSSRFSARDIPESGQVYERGGCDKCNGSGYAGRTGVYEILEGGDEMTDAINRRAPLGEIREIAEKSGMKSLRTRALDLCGRGITTVEEVIRVTAE
jgi:type IV pilus assembly protein PilB